MGKKPISYIGKCGRITFFRTCLFVFVGMMYVKQLCVPEYSSVELEVSSKYEIIFLLYYSYLYLS